MQLPGIPSLVFLAFIIVLLPVSALRSARRIRAMRAPDGAIPGVSRQAMLGGTLLVQIALLFLAWFVGRGFGYEIFHVGKLGPRELGATAVAFGICLALRKLGRMVRTDAERRNLFVYQMVPHDRREWTLWTVVVLTAGVAEEAAYRGVGMAILSYSLGNSWMAAVISAIAFALAHSVQGWKSGVIVFLIALVMQGLVAVTGTLVLAMIVHALYDMVAGWLISKEAGKFEREKVAAGSTRLEPAQSRGTE